MGAQCYTLATTVFQDVITFHENTLITLHQCLHLQVNMLSVYDFIDCLTPKWAISHGNNKFNSCIRWNNNGVRFILDALLDLHTAILLTLQRSVSRHDVIILLFWFRDNQSLILLYKVECLAEMQQIQILQFWFDPIGTGIHTIYHTWGEHDNHYITDAVPSKRRYNGWACTESVRLEQFINHH